TPRGPRLVLSGVRYAPASKAGPGLPCKDGRCDSDGKTAAKEGAAAPTKGSAPAPKQGQAARGGLRYNGYQPWWDIFARRNKSLTAEEERLQRFWHDYYDSLRRYYQEVDRIDWVSYYKDRGYPIRQGNCPNGQCGNVQRIPFAPVYVSP